MTLSNGCGDVVKPNSQQVGFPVLNTGTTEALTAVRHADGINYWVVIQLFQSDLFLSYPVLAIGLGTPVQCRVGSIHGVLNSPSLTEGYGSLRASPNGQWLAATNPDRNLAEIFTFDNRTGQIINARQVPLVLPVGISPNGLEFAAGNNLLYLTSVISSAVVIPGVMGGLFQVNLRQTGLPVTQLATTAPWILRLPRGGPEQQRNGPGVPGGYTAKSGSTCRRISSRICSALSQSSLLNESYWKPNGTRLPLNSAMNLSTFQIGIEGRMT